MSKTRTCGRCQGERVVWVKDEDALPTEPQRFSIDCPTCYGIGLVAVPIAVPEFIERPNGGVNHE